MFNPRTNDRQLNSFWWKLICTDRSSKHSYSFIDRDIGDMRRKYAQSKNLTLRGHFDETSVRSIIHTHVESLSRHFKWPNLECFEALIQQRLCPWEVKIGFLRIILASTLSHAYTKLIVLQIRFPSHSLLTDEWILMLSSLAQKLEPKQVKNGSYIMTNSVASFDVTKEIWLMASWWQESLNNI